MKKTIAIVITIIMTVSMLCSCETTETDKADADLTTFTGLGNNREYYKKLQASMEY